MANNGHHLLDKDGHPIITEAGLVVLKVQHGFPISQRLVQNVAMATHCTVLVIPHECELIQGKLAIEEMRMIHQSIHTIEEELSQQEGAHGTQG